MGNGSAHGWREMSGSERLTGEGQEAREQREGGGEGGERGGGVGMEGQSGGRGGKRVEEERGGRRGTEKDRIVEEPSLPERQVESRDSSSTANSSPLQLYSTQV